VVARVCLWFVSGATLVVDGWPILNGAPAKPTDMTAVYHDIQGNPIRIYHDHVICVILASR